MSKTKKGSGNRNANLDPVDVSNKKKGAGQSISGHPQSEGGSRQGNIGHEYAPETGRSDRQV